jgi:kynurenine formamidase
MHAGMPVFPSDPAFHKEWHESIGEAGFNVSRLMMGAHTGTHVDVPMHSIADAEDTARMPAGCFLGQAVALDVPKQAGEDIEPEDFVKADIRPGDIVLFRTGWDRHRNTPVFYEGDSPGIAAGAMEKLIQMKVKAAGGDFASVDSPAAIAQGSPAHRLAAAARLPLYEALVNLDQVVGTRFFFIGLPLKIEKGEASPVRAVALLDTAISPAPPQG